MRRVNAPSRYEFVGMLSLLLAILLLLLAMQYEHRATRSVPIAMRRPRGQRICEESRARREVGWLHSGQAMDGHE